MPLPPSCVAVAGIEGWLGPAQVRAVAVVHFTRGGPDLSERSYVPTAMLEAVGDRRADGGGGSAPTRGRHDRVRAARRGGSPEGDETKLGSASVIERV